MRRLDGKFNIENEQIVSVNGTVIPEDEPLFLLRARDYLAILALERYREVSLQDGCTDYHMFGINSAIQAFQDFAAKNPGRMKQPGITRGL